MTPAVPPCLNLWKTLYRAAILETNKRVLPQRVSEAEEAVRARGREIFYGGWKLRRKRSLGRRTVRIACLQNRLAAHRSGVIPACPH
jgi:hypothetical protein